MSIDKLFSEKIDRREFLKTCGKATALAGTAYGLESVIGCAPTLKETRGNLVDQKWDCNPILPIPAEGCYIGGFRAHAKEGYEAFARDIGKIPAWWDFSMGKFWAVDEFFPIKPLHYLVSKGIVPEVKYGVSNFKGYKEVAKGNHDVALKTVAGIAAEFGKPYVLIPFKEHNISAGIYWPHAGGSAGWFKEAWRHMHRIFKSEGANANTIWALNYLGTFTPAARTPLETFYPGDDVVDWI
jgi:hypothetical protein